VSVACFFIDAKRQSVLLLKYRASSWETLPMAATGKVLRRELPALGFPRVVELVAV
jgi:hypothetical protein